VRAAQTNQQLEQAHELLAKRSTLDPLTGLGNQRYLQDHGAALLAFAQHQGAKLSLLCVELDTFDVVFKSMGRQIAEKLLVHVEGDHRVRALGRRAAEVNGQLAQVFAPALPFAGVRKWRWALGLEAGLARLKEKLDTK
jgi:predicted signal transduction protein with EAL and GGDEF domain